MIFVTVGTHEQQFNRLIKAVDDLVADGTIKEEVIIQKGYSDYKPKHCKTYKLIGYKDMQKYLDEARIIITHGGPASFMAALERNKTPIVMPRLKKYDEHVNDHQDYFCREVEKRFGNIIVIDDKESLAEALKGDVKAKKSNSCNNVRFNNKLLDTIIRKKSLINIWEINK